jgi:hypothetical protein
MKRMLPIIIMIILSHCFVAYGLDKPTHYALNEDIAKRTIKGFSLDDYIRNQLGFPNGINEEIHGNRIFKWLGDGGQKEDEPDGLIRTVLNRGRSNNHFHNPLLTWDTAGLSDTILGINYTGQSSILWSQNNNQDSGGKWSWYDARDYFYKGLTLTSKSERDSAMANTFRGLGQLMHLIEDASVPLHVRNNIHIIYNYESWVEDIRTSKKEAERTKFSNFIANPISFDKSILSDTPNPFAPIPIARIIDTDTYIGNNPNDTVSTAIGIAEYTNANFFSEDTVFSNTFSYPSSTSVEITDYSIPDPRDSNRTVIRQYYKKVADGEIDYRLATVGFLKDYIMIYIPSYRGLESNSLDEGVYSDYAERLIPRAVGYSAGLLNYFFRGEVEINKEIFEQVTAQGINGLYLTVKNLTPNEEMKNGEVWISYKYKLTGETDFTYGLSNPITSDNIPYEGEAYQSFTFPTPIPADATDIQYLWIFKGTLGQEMDAVVGKVTPGPCRITGKWLCKQDEGVSMVLSQTGTNITASWTDLLVYCSPPNNYVSCIATGTGTFNSSTRYIDLIFNTDMDCCCPQIVYEAVLLSCDCITGRVRNVCNPSANATFRRKGSNAFCSP